MKITVSSLQKFKNKEKISAITAYDALFANIFDGEVEIILVGDSLAMNFGGGEDTIGVSIEEMIYHTKVVRKYVRKSLLISDMPFGYDSSLKKGLKSALKIYKKAAPDALKIEVSESKIPLIESLIDNGIAVMGHIGLRPQFYKHDGGYKVKGKSEEEKKALLDLALKLEDIGCFGILIEGTKSDIARDITLKLKIPTIGIGSGMHTDGQILVWSDAFGLNSSFKPKFVREYLNGEELFKNAIKKYVKDIKENKFPNENETY